MFNLSAVTVVAGQKTLLNDVSLVFESNSITAILGANGAGKSTLFKSLLGEYPLNKGMIKFDGRPLDEYLLKDLSKKRAYIAQAKAGFFSMLVYEYLQLARLQYYETDEQSQNLVLKFSDQFHITHLLMRDVTQLSGGELQLIEFVRAYLQLYETSNMHNKCLLLDEPASALDIKQTRLLYGHLKTFQRAGGCIIIIDHDINAVANLATNLVYIRLGEVLATGASSELFTKVHIDDCFDTSGQIIVHKANSLHENKMYHV
ncbi:iron complex transporter ATP-binding protein [Glaciecola punicea]|jgi:iron complex transport system ATP-binding protein|uniref:ABC transporter ATP-binding protein n=1 Tax=Glaciecola punicea TaxID=56804 RepID=UPI00087241E3|nr:ABC transporter ATP-binding protein [Glaciecola punicea]OFA31941.1 iron complex transporter ATP-binding protein [Glaciecola punicea]